MDRGGIILIDKEAGFTSFETVRRVKRALRASKAGHAGTLDKAASGLLIVCIGEATAVQQILMSGTKRYRAVVRLGVETDTLDAFGKVVRTMPVGDYSEGDVKAVLGRYIGKTRQVPPRYSAIHVNGKRAYLRTIRGEDFTLEPREIEVSGLELIAVSKEAMELVMVVSKGTYVRALARDIARDLGTCGSLLSLRRLAVGPFSIEEAVAPGELAERAERARASEERRVETLPVAGEEPPTPVIPLIPVSQALAHLPAIRVDRESARKIAHGRPLDKVLPADVRAGIGDGYTRVLHCGELLAIVHGKGGSAYFKVFG